MRIPLRNLERFVKDVTDQCLSTRQERSNRGKMFESYATIGSDNPSTPAMFNKTAATIDDVESLLFSPVSLRFHIGDPDIPNIVNEAKGRAAAARIRQMYRQSDFDSLISQAVNSGLVKGVGLTKQLYKRGLTASLVRPEDFGVYRENHTKLDVDMEAFTHTMLITKHQFNRLVAGRGDEHELKAKAHRVMRPSNGMTDTNSAMNIVVGGLYPLQAAGATSNYRGVVDWMSKPRAQIDPAIEHEMLELHETWIWDDRRDDWATFQLIGEDILVLGRYQIINALAYDPKTRISSPDLQGVHPFSTFCPNPVADYFWGMSEVAKLMLLQEAINSRLTGINQMLRKQEDPPTKFVGSTGVNQVAMSRYNKPGGYWVDSNPNAKIDRDNVTIPQDLWGSLHEYERMFDELMGLPPIAKGQGESGVRSAQHAETLVRMFSPRFKDRALLIERDVERCGALSLDIARATIDRKMLAWAPAKAAELETDATAADLALLQPPAPGLVPIYFTFGDLPDDVTLTVDSHSSSPAFSAEAKGLAFDLLKVGAMSPADLVEHVDAPNPDELYAGIARRQAAQAAAAEEERKIKLMTHAGKK